VTDFEQARLELERAAAVPFDEYHTATPAQLIARGWGAVGMQPRDDGTQLWMRGDSILIVGPGWSDIIAKGSAQYDAGSMEHDAAQHVEAWGY